MPPGGDPGQRALDAAAMLLHQHALTSAAALAVLRPWNTRHAQLRPDQLAGLVDRAAATRPAPSAAPNEPNAPGAQDTSAPTRTPQTEPRR